MLTVRPCTVKRAQAYVSEHHRHLPRVQGGMWAVRVLDQDGRIAGVAIVGNPARLLAEEGVLCVLRVATDGTRNACSALLGACARMARAQGATSLVTYTLIEEPGTSLRAAGWVEDGTTAGGTHNRPSRKRSAPVQGGPKRRWWAPWSDRLRVEVE